MRRLPAAAPLALLLCAGCRPEAAPAVASPPVAQPAAPAVAPASPREWTAEAAGGRVVVHQVAAGAGCRLTATEGDVLRWSADVCAATRDDLCFVSPDGERLLVLHPLPEGTAGKDWSKATVAEILARGKVERTLAGIDLVARSFISEMSRDYSWVKGVGSGPGVAPRYAEGGAAVVIDVVDGATLTLGFDGSGIPGRARAGKGDELPALVEGYSPEADESTLWRWEDAEGGLHFSHWNQIPARFRRKAVPVTADVGSFTADPSAPSGGGSNAQAAQAWFEARQRGRSAEPDPNVGPKLNGLTDAQRAAKEAEQRRAEQAKAARDEELAQQRVRRERNAAFRNAVIRRGGTVYEAPAP